MSTELTAKLLQATTLADLLRELQPLQQSMKDPFAVPVTSVNAAALAAGKKEKAPKKVKETPAASKKKAAAASDTTIATIPAVDSPALRDKLLGFAAEASSTSNIAQWCTVTHVIMSNMADLSGKKTFCAFEKEAGASAAAADDKANDDASSTAVAPLRQVLLKFAASIFTSSNENSSDVAEARVSFLRLVSTIANACKDGKRQMGAADELPALFVKLMVSASSSATPVLLNSPAAVYYLCNAISAMIAQKASLRAFSDEAAVMALLSLWRVFAAPDALKLTFPLFLAVQTAATTTTTTTTTNAAAAAAASAADDRGDDQDDEEQKPDPSQGPAAGAWAAAFEAILAASAATKTKLIQNSSKFGTDNNIPAPVCEAFIRAAHAAALHPDGVARWAMAITALISNPDSADAAKAARKIFSVPALKTDALLPLFRFGCLRDDSNNKNTNATGAATATATTPFTETASGALLRLYSKLLASNDSAKAIFCAPDTNTALCGFITLRRAVTCAEGARYFAQAVFNTVSSAPGGAHRGVQVFATAATRDAFTGIAQFASKSEEAIEWWCKALCKVTAVQSIDELTAGMTDVPPVILAAKNKEITVMSEAIRVMVNNDIVAAMVVIGGSKAITEPETLKVLSALFQRFCQIQPPANVDNAVFVVPELRSAVVTPLAKLVKDNDTARWWSTLAHSIASACGEDSARMMCRDEIVRAMLRAGDVITSGDTAGEYLALAQDLIDQQEGHRLIAMSEEFLAIMLHKISGLVRPAAANGAAFIAVLLAILRYNDVTKSRVVAVAPNVTNGTRVKDILTRFAHAISSASESSNSSVSSTMCSYWIDVVLILCRYKESQPAIQLGFMSPPFVKDCVLAVCNYAVGTENLAICCRCAELIMCLADASPAAFETIKSSAERIVTWFMSLSKHFADGGNGNAPLLMWLRLVNMVCQGNVAFVSTAKFLDALVRAGRCTSEPQPANAWLATLGLVIADSPALRREIVAGSKEKAALLCRMVKTAQARSGTALQLEADAREYLGELAETEAKNAGLFLEGRAKQQGNNSGNNNQWEQEQQAAEAAQRRELDRMQQQMLHMQQHEELQAQYVNGQRNDADNGKRGDDNDDDEVEDA